VNQTNLLHLAQRRLYAAEGRAKSKAATARRYERRDAPALDGRAKGLNEAWHILHALSEEAGEVTP